MKKVLPHLAVASAVALFNFAAIAEMLPLQEQTVTVPKVNSPSADMSPTIPAPAANPGEMARRQALVAQYLTPQKYGSLYQTVIEQYSSMAPNNTNVQSLKDDNVFRDQIFAQLQQRASKTFTLSELQAMQRFVDSKEGGSISKKVDALGLQFRQKDLDENERIALRNFSQSPEGKTIAGKSVNFASQSLGEVMRSVLIRQAMNTGL